MNKNTQHIVALSCLVIAGSVVYYLFKYIPEQNKLTLQNKLQSECQEIGSKREKEDKKKTEEMTSQGILYSGKFVFNKEDNTCLYRNRTLSVQSGVEDASIIDLFSNRTLASYTENKNGEITSGDKGRFNYIQNTHFGIE